MSNPPKFRRALDEVMLKRFEPPLVLMQTKRYTISTTHPVFSHAFTVPLEALGTGPYEWRITAAEGAPRVR
jgi:hypothetical protein